MSKPYLGHFEPNEHLILRRAPNHGWIVEASDNCLNTQPALIGAFSNSKDLLIALQSALSSVHQGQSVTDYINAMQRDALTPADTSEDSQ